MFAKARKQGGIKRAEPDLSGGVVMLDRNIFSCCTADLRVRLIKSLRRRIPI